MLSLCLFLYLLPPTGNKANIQSHYRGHKLSMWLNLIPQLHRHFNINDQSMRHHQFQDDLNNRDLYEGSKDS